MPIDALSALPRGNVIVDRMLDAGITTMFERAAVVQLDRSKITTTHGTTMLNVDFPVTALLSVVSGLPDGATVEVANIGSEGFVEIDAALESATARRTAICQFAGDAVRIPLADFQSGLSEQPEFARAIFAAVRARVFISEQLIVCSSRHTVEERLARWLLMAFGKLDVAALPITQEALAGILGTRRASISDAAQALLKSGAITYSRGTVTVSDLARLLRWACPCYAECEAVLHDNA